MSGREDLSPGTNASGTKRNITFRIEGLSSDYAIGQFTAGIAATNASGNYQGTGTDRDFTFTVQTSADGTTWTDYDSETGNINKSVGTISKWNFTGSEGAVVPTSPFYLRLQLVNNSSLGCFSSLFSMTMHRDANAETGIAGTPVDEHAAGGTVYDISGRPVQSDAKGMVIEDGRVVVKRPSAVE